MNAPIARHGPVLDLLTMLGGVVGLICLVSAGLGVVDRRRREPVVAGP